MQLLLEHNARVDEQDGSGRTALHLVSWFGHCDAVPLLLAHKADPGIQDETLHTPLHYAAWFNQVEICRLLIEGRAPLDATDHSKKTPLHFGVQHRRPEVVRLLLDAGADWRLTDSDGKTPEAVAIAEGFTDILDILTDFAKKSEASGPTTVLDELIAEHKAIRENVETLAHARDRFLEPFNAVGLRIDGINNQIQRLGEQQAELAATVTRVKAVLNEIMLLVSAEVSAPEPPKEEGQKAEQKQEQPKVLMCRVCGQNPSAWRCKVCHSTFCKGCWAKMKPGRCPICRPDAKT
jgi:ankyrin repeat protein